MQQLSEHTIMCPYCGELVEVLIDFQEIGQQYIEDCQVCCRPITFKVSSSPEGDLEVSVSSENEAY